MKNVPQAPGSLEESLRALRADHEFLLRGDVFTPDVIDTWIWYKTVNEVQAMQLRPHPYEFCSLRHLDDRVQWQGLPAGRRNDPVLSRAGFPGSTPVRGGALQVVSFDL
jgi:hypothetical protein